MNEHDFQTRVTDMATRFGWKFWHVPAPMKWARGEFRGASEAAGLPDLILLHDDPPRMIFAELKGDGGKLADKQREFLASAKLVAEAAYTSREETSFASPIGVYAWTPTDEPVVEQILR